MKQKTRKTRLREGSALGGGTDWDAVAEEVRRRSIELARQVPDATVLAAHPEALVQRAREIAEHASVSTDVVSEGLVRRKLADEAVKAGEARTANRTPEWERWRVEALRAHALKPDRRPSSIFAEIAKRHDVKPNTVRKRLAELGVKLS